MKKIKVIEEIYTDEYRTLYQAIRWNVEMDKMSDGLESRCAKAMVNPHLTILLKRRYLTDTEKLVKEEKFIGGNKDE